MNTQLHEYTRTQQSSLANYVRTGVLNNVEGLTENRVHYYRKLVYNVLNDSLQSAFPITYDLLDEDEWNDLVEKFFCNHNCQSNEIWKMPYEFCRFTKKYGDELALKYPHLNDLLLFEWTEIEVYMMEDKIPPQFAVEGNLLNDVLVLNPEFNIIKLQYPVHLKGSKEIKKDDQGNYFVLIYREPKTFKVQFVNLSVYYAWLIARLLEGSKPLIDIYESAEETFQVDKSTLKKNSYQFITDMINNKFILGFKNDSNSK
ncbi:MAG: putative DNA-binding domain-containing protein [Bacteroidota bacterium]